MTRLAIEKRFSLVEKKVGAYHAFPTLVRQGDRLWMTCRSGEVSHRQAHGIAGQVVLYCANKTQPELWTPQGVLFAPSAEGTRNEIDAILSLPDPQHFLLATRDFIFNQRNDVYLSLNQTPFFRGRVPLSKISDQQAICFGHIRHAVDGGFLMPAYSGFPDEPVGTPVLLVSMDQGRSWSLRAKVASSTQVGTRLTEYSLGFSGASNWTVLIRNETAPYHLYRGESRDNGRSWSIPEKTDLFGHAPMILDKEDDRGKLVLYRDLSEIEPSVAIGFCAEAGAPWQSIGRLATYFGSIYDGGYGDLVQLADNRYLAVYYLCDEDHSPWIEGAIFSLI